MHVDQLSGDSTVSDLQFANGVASLIYEDSESGVRFRVSVPTDSLFSDAGAESGSVHVRLLSLADVLPVDFASGRYMIPSEFGRQMDAIRGGLHLALGRRAEEFPYLLQVRGYRLLIACPIRSVDHVVVMPE